MPINLKYVKFMVEEENSAWPKLFQSNFDLNHNIFLS